MKSRTTDDAVKMGRPTTDPKEKSLMVRLSEKDMEKLDFCSRKTGKPKAEIIRIGIDNIYNELKGGD